MQVINSRRKGGWGYIISCPFKNPVMMWSSPRCPLQYHSLVHSENNSYFLGIGPIHYVDLTCIFRLFFPFYVVPKIGLSTITYFLIYICFQMLLSWHWIMFCTLFWCRIWKMIILKAFIYLPCINTQWRAIAPFEENSFISSRDNQKTGLYQGSADRCEGYRNSDLIRLIQKSQAINYCNQSVLAIVPDLNIFVFSITIDDLILRSALVRL